MSRKRPAPGTSPLVHPQIPPVANFPTPDSEHLSNDQFLQWGHNVPPNLNTVDPNAPHYQALPHQPHAAMQNMQGPNQLTRRAGSNQLVGRNRAHEGGIPVVDPDVEGGGRGGTPSRASESADPHGETEEQLHERALAAKKEAQAKRKQIPPFVQKLSRCV